MPGCALCFGDNRLYYHEITGKILMKPTLLSLIVMASQVVIMWYNAFSIVLCSWVLNVCLHPMVESNVTKENLLHKAKKHESYSCWNGHLTHNTGYFLPLTERIKHKYTKKTSFTMQTKSCHKSNFVITDGNVGGHYDNSKCHKLWPSWHHENSQFSVYIKCLYQIKIVKQ